MLVGRYVLALVLALVLLLGFMTWKVGIIIEVEARTIDKTGAIDLLTMTMQMQNQRDGIDEYETDMYDSPSSVEADDFKNPLHSAGLASPSTTTQVGSGVENARLQNIRRE